MNMRKALIKGNGITAQRVEAYLPSNYSVIYEYEHIDFGNVVIIEGTDSAGWTLDDYVLPRLASGLMFGTEEL